MSALWSLAQWEWALAGAGDQRQAGSEGLRRYYPSGSAMLPDWLQ